MKSKSDPWQKLASAVRQARLPSADVEAPFGFSARVVAQWRQQSIVPLLDWNRLGWGALATALTIAVVCVALNYENLRSWRQDSVVMLTVSEIPL